MTYSPLGTPRDWPGDVRELERMAFVPNFSLLSRRDVIELDDLPPAVRGEFAEEMVSALESNRTMRAWTSRYARLMLDKCKGNKRETCRMLGISYHTLVAYLNHGTNGPTGGDEAPADGPSVLSEASECDLEQ